MIKIRLRNRPWEIVEVYEHQLLDLQRWDMIHEYVEEDAPAEEPESYVEDDDTVVLDWYQVQDYFDNEDI